MLHVTTRVTGAILWANLHLLFWLSLMPFATAWMGENHFAPIPTAAYGLDMLATAIAYYILQSIIVRSQGPRSALASAMVAISRASSHPWHTSSPFRPRSCMRPSRAPSMPALP